MRNLSARVLRSVAAIVAAGTLSLTGISAASAMSEPEHCRTYYEAAGFSNPGECISSVFGRR